MNRTSHLISRREALQWAGAAAAGLACGARAATNAPAPAVVIPPRDEVTLANDRLRVVVSPSDGAGLLAFAVKKDGAWLDVAPDARVPASNMRYASWLMVPYSNRIENGRFRFEGKDYQLRNGEKHSIHGDGRNRPWTVAKKASDQLRCTLRSSDFADFNWPWPIEVEQSFALEDATFAQRLILRNRGTTAMPAGFGWHPYYKRTLTDPAERVRLQMRCTGVYPDANGDCLPDGPPVPLPADLDYSAGKEVPLDQRYDHCLTGYDGQGAVEWPRTGVKLEYACSPNVTHFVYFNPTDRPVWAAEPAANGNNGVNLLDRGDASHGVIILPPGGELQAHFLTRVTA